MADAASVRSIDAMFRRVLADEFQDVEFGRFPILIPPIACGPPLRYGNLQLSSRYLIAPLAGFTNLPFRRIVRELGGVGLATTDLINSRGLLQGSRKTLDLIETCAEDFPLSVQIYGTDLSVMHDAAQFLEARGIASIDINMGCPVRRVVKQGAGAGMMCRPGDAVALVRTVVDAVRLPVSVKMRLGWDSQQLTAPKFAREFEQVGVAAVSVHGRTREQGFGGTVDLYGIRAVVEAVENMPVIGNGDVRNVPDAERMFRETGCQGIAIGRGALANPWIFRQLVQWETTGEYDPAGSFEDRMQLLLRQFRYIADRIGTDKAIVAFRKMGHWYASAMGVNAELRNRFQLAKTETEFYAVLEEMTQVGPTRVDSDGRLKKMSIPVPSGPIERW